MNGTSRRPRAGRLEQPRHPSERQRPDLEVVTSHRWESKRGLSYEFSAQEPPVTPIHRPMNAAISAIARRASPSLSASRNTGQMWGDSGFAVQVTSTPNPCVVAPQPISGGHFSPVPKPRTMVHKFVCSITNSECDSPFTDGVEHIATSLGVV